MNLDDILAAKDGIRKERSPYENTRDEGAGEGAREADGSEKSASGGDSPTAPANAEVACLAICEHIKPSGARCGSPALRDHKLCYYHAKVRKTVPRNNLFMFLGNPGRKENDPDYAFEFPDLEDAAGLQIAFMQFIYGVSQHRIEEWRARMILSALHGAAANVRLMDKAAGERPAHAALERGTQAPKKRPAGVNVGETSEEQAG
jgi:hypothetical protein